MRLAARLAGVDIISRTGGDIMDHNAHQPGCFPKAAEGAILMMASLDVARLAPVDIISRTGGDILVHI
jgi:hypothetical protein